MSLLVIEQFSCLRYARFETANINILIGAQGSGKSVTTKLNYFFQDIISRQFQCAEKGMDIDDFKKDCARQFRIWFPASAWGKDRFNINFSAGLNSFRILRRMSKGIVADDVAVSFSDYFVANYNELISAYADVKRDEIDDDAESFRRSFETSYKIRDKFETSFAKELGNDYKSFQVYIPAGRSFFTSIGKLFAAFEQGSTLDPVTLKFAKIFANLRENYMRFPPFRSDKDGFRERKAVMKELFGGEIKFDNETEIIETKDKRKVPFSALSSGQQELLPMWLLVDFFADRGGNRKGGDIFYIEEPEAHLFPEAQSVLLDFLIGSLASRSRTRELVLTTHSPYILAKLNNYLKAGIIGKSRRNSTLVSSVIPKECWLDPTQIKAYAIDNGLLVDLIDEDGMIDANYIDGVSRDVSSDFEKLLDIQYPESRI